MEASSSSTRHYALHTQSTRQTFPALNSACHLLRASHHTRPTPILTPPQPSRDAPRYSTPTRSSPPC
jgi:hypothetical protein